MQQATTLFHVCGFRDDVQGSSYRIDGQLGGAKSTLHLHRIHGVAQSRPIRPINPTVFHVIDGNSIDEYRHIALIETPNIDPAIAKSTAALCRINTWRNVQRFDQFLIAQLFLNRSRIQRRNGHGCLPINRNRCDDVGFIQSYGGSRQSEHAHIHGRHADTASSLEGGQLDVVPAIGIPNHTSNHVGFTRLARRKTEPAIEIGDRTHAVFFQVN